MAKGNNAQKNDKKDKKQSKNSKKSAVTQPTVIGKSKGK